jgi:hypothetical protein
MPNHFIRSSNFFDDFHGTFLAVHLFHFSSRIEGTRQTQHGHRDHLATGLATTKKTRENSRQWAVGSKWLAHFHCRG